MNSKLRHLLLIVFSIFPILTWGTESPSTADSIRISLLTCAPGEEIYSLFGHTAIRYEEPARGIDRVYNYGLFSFNTPNFILRFALGKTDYQLGVEDYRRFAAEYEYFGRSVWQQTLNLTAEEQRQLITLLEKNYRPENRIYRYNFFYDNCATRPRDKVEESLQKSGSQLLFSNAHTENGETKSYRDIVHQYTKGHKWDELGIDMCLGSEADKPIDARKQMFAPFYLLEAAKKATIVVGDSVRPLILHEKKVVDAEPENVGDGFPLSPLACVFILIGITCFVGWLQFKTRKIIWIWNLLLFGVQGLAGCVITFLVFFSTHPTVGSNWLILLLNPIPLLYLPVMVCRAIKGKKDLYHTINVVYLTLFIMIMPFVQQKFNVTVLPLALCLLICSANHVLLYYRQNNK